MRDKYGRILDPYQLAQELPKFIDLPLVALGPKFPFYDEVGTEDAEPTVDVEHYARTQLTSIVTFLVRGGDFSSLQPLWTRIGLQGNAKSSLRTLIGANDGLL